MSKGHPIGTCNACGSEIVELCNEGVFGGGVCEACERLRYETQPALLEALDYLFEQTVDRDLAVGNALDEHEEEARQMALAAIAKAHGTAA